MKAESEKKLSQMTDTEQSAILYRLIGWFGRLAEREDPTAIEFFRVLEKQIDQATETPTMPVQCCVCKSFYVQGAGTHCPTPNPIPSAVSHGYCGTCLPKMEAEFETAIATRKQV